MSDTEQRRQHVYPTQGREHVTAGLVCWCAPTYRVVCPECEDDGPDAGCWRCHGEGAVECVDPDGYESPNALIVVHRDV